MMWSYRFVSKGPDTGNTRELPIKFKTHDNGREWVVYAGIGPHTPSKAGGSDAQDITSQLESASATIAIERRIYTLDGDIPNTRRHRQLRPHDERVREKEEAEKKKNQLWGDAWNALHKNSDALNFDFVSRHRIMDFSVTHMNSSSGMKGPWMRIFHVYG
jgi:hypothetical protein